MRDILYKNLTSIDHNRRDILLSEVSEMNGVMTKTHKHFIYMVRNHALLHSQQELSGWVKKYAGKGPQLKDLSVLKSYDSNSGEEKFEVRIVGNLYVMHEQDIYNIDFTQVFKIDRKGEALKGHK